MMVTSIVNQLCHVNPSTLPCVPKQSVVRIIDHFLKKSFKPRHKFAWKLPEETRHLSQCRPLQNTWCHNIALLPHRQKVHSRVRKLGFLSRKSPCGQVEYQANNWRKSSKRKWQPHFPHPRQTPLGGGKQSSLDPHIAPSLSLQVGNRNLQKVYTQVFLGALLPMHGNALRCVLASGSSVVTTWLQQPWVASAKKRNPGKAQ